MKKFIIFPILIILFNCSNNDDSSESEFIVGKWKVIQRFESNVEIELNNCDPFVVHEFNSDFSMRTYTINESQIPPNTACGVYPLGWHEWNKIGENLYESRNLNLPDLLITEYKKEGEYLFLEYSTNDNKAVLKRN